MPAFAGVAGAVTVTLELLQTVMCPVGPAHPCAITPTASTGAVELLSSFATQHLTLLIPALISVTTNTVATDGSFAKADCCLSLILIPWFCTCFTAFSDTCSASDPMTTTADSGVGLVHPEMAEHLNSVIVQVRWTRV